MAKVLIATEKPFAKPARDRMVELIKAADLEVVLLEDYKERSDLLKAVENVEALIIRSDQVKEDVLAAGKKLKICVRAGAGTDNVEVAVKEKIIVENTPGQNSNAVAELAFGMMVMMARGQYDGKSGSELRGKKLGLHAFGAVGKEMARIGKGFEMQIAAFDPYLPDGDFEKLGIEHFTDVKALYKECDYVSLHIPATRETKLSINYDLLSLMRPTATLINTARAEVIQEEDLAKILAERPKFKYATDVTTKNWEELKKQCPNQLFGTPKKMGAQTTEANFNAGVAAVNQIIAFLKKGEIQFQVKK